MAKNLLRYLSFFIIIFCVSCSDNTKVTSFSMPGIEIPLKDMNNQIQFVNPPVLGNSYKNNNLLFLDITNRSDKSIIFSGDYGVKIFILKDGDWVPVKNNFHYGNQEEILPVKTSYPFGLPITLLPFIPELKENVTIRVVVTGHIENSPDKMIGAYIDIPLKPEE